MFFCESCRVQRAWPESMFRSHGPCEICGTVNDCYEVKSSLLPMPPDRVPPSFFEADEEGYWQGTDEAGFDGNAKGIEFVQYVDPPDQQLETFIPAQDEGFKFTEDELGEWWAWFPQQYPDLDCNGDSDIMEVSIFGEYQPGESTQDLYDRLLSEHRSYMEVHNRHCIFYHGLEDYIVHCKVQRHQKEEA